jgi:hypothetical protein
MSEKRGRRAVSNRCNFTFWTPGHRPKNGAGLFGCASHGVAASGVWHEPETDASETWPRSLSGAVVSGAYDAVIAELALLLQKPSAAIILFAQGTGMEVFLRSWHTLFPDVPVVGGAAARGTDGAQGELLPSSVDLAVLLIDSGRWRAEALNVHDVETLPLEFRADGARRITHLRPVGAKAWQTAVDLFKGQQEACGRLADDFESITLSDINGRNIHCSIDGDDLESGADLPEDGPLDLRVVTAEDAAKRLAHFCAEPDALVFGCAGLRSLLDEPLAVATGTLAGFMFGELVSLANGPQFGNLMAARLTPVSD